MKKLVVALAVVFLLALGIRIAYVNINAERPKTVVYEQGVEVEFGNNFYESSAESRDGYSIKVLSSRIVKTDDFLKENNIDKLSIPTDIDDPFIKYVPEYVVDVEVLLKNTSNNKDNGGIDLYYLSLAADDFKLQVNDNIWDALYPQLNASKRFKLRENTVETIHFPFAISYGDAEVTKAVSSDMLFVNDYQLILSKYPMDMRVNIVIDK